MKVELLAYTENPELVVAQAAKLCYSPVGVDEIREKLDEESTEKFVKMLMGFSHASPPVSYTHLTLPTTPYV